MATGLISPTYRIITENFAPCVVGKPAADHRRELRRLKRASDNPDDVERGGAVCRVLIERDSLVIRPVDDRIRIKLAYRAVKQLTTAIFVVLCVTDTGVVLNIIARVSGICCVKPFHTIFILFAIPRPIKRDEISPQRRCHRLRKIHGSLSWLKKSSSVIGTTSTPSRVNLNQIVPAKCPMSLI